MLGTVGLLTRYYRLKTRIWLWQFHMKLDMKTDSIREISLEGVEIQVENVTLEILREMEIVSDGNERHLHRLAEMYT